MSKDCTKCAFIRGKDISGCPYGLPVTQACLVVGDVVLQMQALENVEKEDVAETKKRNKIIYYTQKNNQKCPSANDIMKQFNKVECSWGDAGAGEGSHYLPASPLYPRLMIG